MMDRTSALCPMIVFQVSVMQSFAQIASGEIRLAKEAFVEMKVGNTGKEQLK